MSSIKVLGHLGVGGQKGFVYKDSGIAPCICATVYKDPVKITAKKKRIQNITVNLQGGAVLSNTESELFQNITCKSS